MKQSMKKFFAAIAIIAVTMTASVGAFAEYDPNKTVDPNVVSTKMVKPIFAVHTNGTLLEGASVYVNGNDKIMIPIRAVAESLGFTVGWDSGRVTLTKGPVYVTFAIGEDGYTFARTAPMQIGQAPELTDEKTYVPSNFFDEILGAEIAINQNGEISIKHGDDTSAEEEKAGASVDVISVTAQEGFTAVLVADKLLGEVQLNISKESDIVLADGSKGSPSDIKEGMTLTVAYGEAMTMSLPPQNNPVKITVLSKENVVEGVSVKGEITEVAKADENGNIACTLKAEITETNLNEEIVLIISDETKITKDGAGLKKEDLTVGAKIEAVHSQAMTMSLPPQTAAISVAIVG